MNMSLLERAREMFFFPTGNFLILHDRCDYLPINDEWLRVKTNTSFVGLI